MMYQTLKKHIIFKVVPPCLEQNPTKHCFKEIPTFIVGQIQSILLFLPMVPWLENGSMSRKRPSVGIHIPLKHVSDDGWSKGQAKHMSDFHKP